MNEQPRRRLLCWLGLGAIALLAAAEPPHTVPPTSAPAPAPSSAGVRAFVDPTTGELTANPSPEQLRRMALAPRAGLSRSMVGLRPFALARGGRGVNLEGRFDSAYRVEIGKDGAFHMTCGDPAHAETPHSHDADAAVLSAPRSDASAPTAATDGAVTR